jgi:23S rRNA pseudouridine1911/1915/1917 synthase
MPEYETVVGPEAADSPRLDVFVAEALGLLSRSQLKVRGLSARIGGKPVKLSRRLKPGDKLSLAWNDPEASELTAEDLPLDVLYEDDRVVVIDKRQGMVVHPGAGNRSGTLANALLFRRLARGAAGVGFRPGIVHRLDKDTSGVMIAAYDDAALAFLAGQFKARTVRKTYLAFVKDGPPADSGRLDWPIGRDPRLRQRFACVERGGKPAVTEYRVVRRFGAYSLVLLRPKTGRTHQLRVHLRRLGCPIVGDPLYGRPDPAMPEASLMLHARRLTIRLPGGADASTFRAAVPERFRTLARRLARRR